MPWAKEGITSMILPVFFKHPVTLRCIKIHSTNWLKEIVKEFIDQVFRCDEFKNFLGLEVKDRLASVEMAIITKSKIPIWNWIISPTFSPGKNIAKQLPKKPPSFHIHPSFRHLTSRIGPWIQTHLGFGCFPIQNWVHNKTNGRGIWSPFSGRGVGAEAQKALHLLRSDGTGVWLTCWFHFSIPSRPSVLWPPLHSASPNPLRGSTSSHREQSLVFDHHQPQGSAFITKKIWTNWNIVILEDTISRNEFQAEKVQDLFSANFANFYTQVINLFWYPWIYSNLDKYLGSPGFVIYF